MKTWTAGFRRGKVLFFGGISESKAPELTNIPSQMLNGDGDCTR